MKSIIDNMKKHWKNYVIVLLVLVVMFNGSIVQLGNTLTGGSSMSFAKQESYDSLVSSRAASSFYYEDSGDSLGSVERQVVKNANVNLETSSYESTKSSIKSLTKSHEGLVLWENENKNNDNNMYLSMRVKVNAQELDIYLSEIQGLNVEVNSLSISGNDVTGSYTDYTQRLERYEVQIAKYEEMLKFEKITIEEEVQVQSRIDQLEDQIFYYSNRIENVDEDVAYSEVYISLSEKPSVLDDVGFIGFKDVFKEFISALDSGVRLLLLILGFIIPFGVVYLIYRFGRRFF